MDIGKRIKERRKELGMSADQLASKLGKSRATLYRYENGDIENLPLDILEPVAKALHTTPAQLMGWEEEQKKNDIQTDIVLRMRSDENFMEAVMYMYNLDDEKLESVKQLLVTFQK